MKHFSEAACGSASIALGAFRAWGYSRPHGGIPRGGDRFSVDLHASGHLFFHVSDAPGHGRTGAHFWSLHEEVFQKLWLQMLDAGPSAEALAGFAGALNDHLCVFSGPGAALCIGYGVFLTSGKLLFANCGYGNHAMLSDSQGRSVATDTGKEPGIKLGWLPSREWPALPGAFVLQEVEDVRRCALITDGFLGDDHLDPTKTLEEIQHLADRIGRLPCHEAMDAIVRLPHDRDDATAVLMHRDAHGISTLPSTSRP